MNNIIALMGFSLCFTIGITTSIVYAQNTTTQYAPVVQSSDALIASVVGIVTAISGIVIALVNKGILDKRVGTVAVMAADTAWAVKDNRQLIKDGLQTSYDTAKITSPEAVAIADRDIAPHLATATKMVDEYKNKVDRFAAIARKLSTRQSDSIEEMKGDIPDRIVPS